MLAIPPDAPAAAFAKETDRPANLATRSDKAIRIAGRPVTMAVEHLLKVTDPSGAPEQIGPDGKGAVAI